MAQDILARARKLIEDRIISRAALARAAGLHPNSLRDVLSPEWNPTADTLSKLERAMDSEDEDEFELATVEEMIAEVRNGRMVILVDDEDRENEGDLVIPAQMATPESVNFMATNGRGLICLCLTSERASHLGLELMARNNGTRHGTAFTVSIEAREGVDTGISAADRARTIAVAVDAGKTKDDLVTPGHVFPLIARDGGVLVRAGHTEAAIDLPRLAGLNPSGVICEIMNDDGTMARLDDLKIFARKHGLKIGTIRDLIEYRRRNDHLVECIQQAPFETDYGGDWTIKTYRNKIDGSVHLVLQKGAILPDVPALVRMHTISILSDVLGSPGPRKRILQRSMTEIGEAGAGLIVLLMPGEPDHLIREVDGTGGRDMELRSYGIGAQILADLGVHDMILLTNSHHNLVALEGYGLSIKGERAIPKT
ncbi:MAG: 3,4-dihydroxy-2-butanone-4-phosphate synthase [Novosphingobium sp.]|nr:3,4-dihydroxy-2-butanone-4-phosphate synthase [Novosphingobium sp.]